MASVNTSVARYALGAATLIVVIGGLAIAAVAVRRRTLPDWTGAPARLAEVVIGLALLIAILEVLGTLGLFELGPIVIACALVGLAGVRELAGTQVARRHSAERRGWTVTTATTAVALVAGAVVLAEWGALTIQSYDVGIRGFDSLWYHLPWAASFAQTGNIVSLRFTDVEYLTPFYPATAEMLHGLGIVLLGRDTLSPGLNLVWLGLTLLAAYCIGRPRGVGAATTIGAALAMGTTMMDYSQAGSAANDVVAVFFLLAAVALLVTEPSARRSAAVLAAIAAGLAVGTKLTVLAPVLALTVGVIAIAPRGRRTATAGLWLGPLIVAGGFWYARNLIAVGNPLPWTSFGGVLPTPAAPLQQHTGYSVAHYLTSAHFWSAFAQPALAAGLGRWWWAVLAVAIVGPDPVRAAAGRSGTNYRHAEVSSQAAGAGCSGAVALFSLAAYLITPETAAGTERRPGRVRLQPALPGAGADAGAGGGPAGAGARRPTSADGNRGRARGRPRGDRGRTAAVALAAHRRRDRRSPWRRLRCSAMLALAQRSRARPAIAIATAAALVVAGAAAGYPLQRHYLRGRYAYQPNVSYLARAWALFRTVHNSRVGVVGTFGGFFSYPFYGLDISNRVQYVAERGPHGSFTPISTCARWRAQVNSDHLKYLITTPARDPWHPTVLTSSPETRWTATDPAAAPVFTEQALGQPIVVFRLRGPLDPAGCLTKLKVSSIHMTTAADPLTDQELLDTEWDLGPLVDGEGRAGAERQLGEGKDRASKFQSRYAGKVAELDAAALQTAMRELEEINELIGRAGSYASLEFATDTADPARGALLQLVQERATEIETLLLFFDLEWAEVDDEKADELLASDELDRYRHHLQSVRRYRPHLLSESEEKILAEKSISSQAAWGRLFGELTAALRVDLDETELTLEVALSRLQSPDREVRRSAADAVSAALEPGLRTRGFIYNTLVFDKSVEDRLRHYPNWLASRNLANEASDESVMALIKAVRGRYDIPQRWYRLKAKLLGVDRLADYDRSAPVLAEDIVYSWGEARDLVLDTYQSFSPVAGEVTRQFFDDHWIDAPVRPHKRGGAFCAYTVPSVHPYVMLNFTATRRDVLTMAHELGHGLHASLARPQGVFHQSTPADPGRDRVGLRRGAGVRADARRGQRRRAAARPACRAGRRRDRDRVPTDGDEPVRAPRAHAPAQRG